MRIRPAAYDGSGHDQNGMPVKKSLDNWNDKSVTLGHEFLFSKGSAHYTFPKKVLGPEKTQVEVFNDTMPNLIHQFTMPKGRNVLYLAYG